MRTQLRLGASLLAILVCAAGTAGADVYRWTDESGNTHFTSDLGQVPPQYRIQAAEPAESKSTFNEHEAPAAPVQRATPAASPTRAPVPRIRTDLSEPSRPRMADFEEKAPEPKRESPQKYIRDCEDPTRRCKSWVNPEWKRWNEERKASEAAADAEE
jgi:hypothetical protein